MIRKIKIITVIVALVSATVADLVQPLYALNGVYDEQFYSLNNILVYNPEDNVCGVTDNGEDPATATSLQKKVWEFFEEKGLTPEQTAGVMANLSHESGFQTSELKTEEESFGIAGWKGDELTALKDAATSKGVVASTLDFQLGYLYDLLNARSTNREEYSEYSTEWEGLTKQLTAEDALVFFHHEFEASPLLGFDQTDGSDEYKAALEFTQNGYGLPATSTEGDPLVAEKAYTSSKQAVIGERGGSATPSGLDRNGREGVKFFLKALGPNSGSSNCAGASGTAVHPIANGDRVNEGYGGPRPGLGGAYCNTSSQGRVKWHNGYDLNGANNTTPVLAAMDGTVTKINYGNPALDTVTITHPDGFALLYMHMNKDHINVKVGDVVTAGQEIGKVGTGNGAYGAHLHFEISAAGNTNPQIAALHINNCDGAVSINPNVFMKVFGVSLCPANNCDNPVTEA